MVLLFAQAAPCPPLPPLHCCLASQIILLGLSVQNLRLLRQARDVRKARRPTACAHTHEALLRVAMDGLRADVARLALRVVGALLARKREGLLVFFVGVVLLGAAALFYPFAQIFVPAVPMLLLASRPAVACLAAAALLGRCVWQRGGAGGALCEEVNSGEGVGHRVWRRLFYKLAQSSD